MRRLPVGTIGIGLVLAAACSHPTPPVTESSPSAAETAIRGTIAALNAGAGQSVTDQQTTLQSLIDVGQRATQAKCPAATSTLEFLPVWSSLAVAPDWHPPAGTMSGTIYSLPTLIRIHRQDRITGTDLTDLHVAVAADGASLPSLCVS